MRKSKNFRKITKSRNQRLPEIDHGAGATTRDIELEAEVLFQRIYGKWYAFSQIQEDTFMSPVSEDEVLKRIGKRSPRDC